MNEIKLSTQTEQCQDPFMVIVAPIKEMFIRLFENSSDLQVP